MVRLRETALLRQGLLSEPQASSGPAAMLLAVSRSPSSIPRRSPCLERCHLPLAFLYTSTSQNPKNIPDCIHSRSDATFLWRPSTTSTSQNLKNIPACIHPRSDVTFLWRPSPSFSQNLKNIPDCIHRTMPPSSGVPRPHPYTPKKARHLHIPKTPDSHQSYISWK